MGCYMQFVRAMYLLFFHHFMIVLSRVNSMLSHHGDRHVLEESYCSHMY